MCVLSNKSWVNLHSPNPPVACWAPTSALQRPRMKATLAAVQLDCGGSAAFVAIDFLTQYNKRVVMSCSCWA